MALAIRWTEEWAIGEPRIDEQHKELFARVDALMEAVGSTARKELVADTLAFLEVYVLRHFRDEERIMQEAGYPALDQHKAQHSSFLDDYGRLKIAFESGGVTSSLAADVSNQVCAWLLHHVGKTDRAFGQYLAHLRP